MRILPLACAAFSVLTASAQATDTAAALIHNNKVKIVAIGEGGFDPRWREPTCSITKTDKDEYGESYMFSHYDTCKCQNSLKATYQIADTQDNPDQHAVVCYIQNN